ncbi:hypothetical protein F5Y01DRAFT_212291 [Xylaria sp. FL0043]|nr:hypothetical protein F5Y01DRAFT_212291 [Xylaria sp. FL0043]
MRQYWRDWRDWRGIDYVGLICIGYLGSTWVAWYVRTHARAISNIALFRCRAPQDSATRLTPIQTDSSRAMDLDLPTVSSSSITSEPKSHTLEARGVGSGAVPMFPVRLDKETCRPITGFTEALFAFVPCSSPSRCCQLMHDLTWPTHSDKVREATGSETPNATSEY